MSPNFSAIPNMERCFNVTSIVRGKTTSFSASLSEVDVPPFPAEMEHWHVPYDYPRADRAQAWLLKCLERAIARDAERESGWMFKQRCVRSPHGCPDERRSSSSPVYSEAIEQTGRPEPTKQNLKLPRLSNPFGKKSSKAEWKEATIFELIPELAVGP